MNALIVHVTQDHIDKGWPGRTDRCPVALALQDATGDPHFRCSYQHFWRHPGQYIPLPEGVGEKITHWDAFTQRKCGEQITPFAFEIPWPI